MRVPAFVYALAPIGIFAVPSVASTSPAAPQQAVVANNVADPFCSAKSAPIAILGVFHFANPGLDARNMDADDVLSSRRQAELQVLADRLARFRPTKIMVEAPFRDRGVAARFGRYLVGDLTLGRNETEQIGFRLAKRLKLAGVTPIDFEMRMSGLRPDELDSDWKPQPQPSAPSPKTLPMRAPTEEEQLLRRSTLNEYLLLLNDPTRANSEHSRDYPALLLPDPASPALYERADALANWYKRNLRMFANISRETRFPDDRVLLIVGSGHQKILSDLARDADFFCLVDVRDYLR